MRYTPRINPRNGFTPVNKLRHKRVFPLAGGQEEAHLLLHNRENCMSRCAAGQGRHWSGCACEHHCQKHSSNIFSMTTTKDPFKNSNK